MSMGQSHLFLIENLTRIHLGFQTHVILLTSLISVAKFDLADQRGGEVDNTHHTPPRPPPDFQTFLRP